MFQGFFFFHFCEIVGVAIIIHKFRQWVKIWLEVRHNVFLILWDFAKIRNNDKNIPSKYSPFISRTIAKFQKEFFWENFRRIWSRIDRKIEMFLESSFVLATSKNLLSEYGDVRLFFSAKYGDFGVFFFLAKQIFFCTPLWHWIFLGSEISP